MKITKPYCLVAIIFLLNTPLFSCGGGGNSGGGGDPAISVTISPIAPTVGISQTIVFSATVSGGADPNVIWTIEENAGGAINQAGTYTAPNTTGTYHVIATSQEDTTRKARATVTVVLIP